MPDDLYKKCPGCGNEIKAGASYCKYCKSLVGKLKHQLAKEETEINKTNQDIVPVKPVSREGPVSNIDRMEVKIDDLYNIVNQVNKEIARKQSLPYHRPESSLSKDSLGKDKVKEIIRYFTNAYSERMESNISTSFAEREYSVEEKKLRASLSEEVWDKLDESTQTLLVSARIMYNDLMVLEKNSDYSGVCLLVIKALEREMIKRFYVDYIRFLEKRYSSKTKIKVWPTPLLNKYDRKKVTKKYTLIGVIYILCYTSSNTNTEQQNENNKRRLLEYGRKKLFLKGSDDEAIEKSLHDCAEKIERFCNDHRNPMALTSQLETIGAEDCAGLLSDVESFLKSTLQEFSF